MVWLSLQHAPEILGNQLNHRFITQIITKDHNSSNDQTQACTAPFILNYSGFRNRAIKCKPFLVPKVGSWSQAFHVCGNWGWKCYLVLHVLVLREQHNLPNAVFCEERFVKNHALYMYVHLTYKDIDRFGNGWVYEFRSRSRDITNKPCTSSSYDTGYWQAITLWRTSQMLKNNQKWAQLYKQHAIE